MLGTIISGALRGLTQILADRALRRIFWRTLLLALVAYGIAFGLAWLVVDYFLNFDVSWLPDFALSWLRGFLEASVLLGVIGLMWAIFPAVFTGLSSIFLDEAALAVEKRHYPMDAPGKEPAFWPSIRRTLQFTLLVVFINILLMPLYLVGLFLHQVGKAQALDDQFFVEHEFDPLLPAERQLADVHAGLQVADDFGRRQVLVFAADDTTDIGIVTQFAFFTQFESLRGLCTVYPSGHDVDRLTVRGQRDHRQGA